ncbi:hypothetical protein GGR55DRAFT_440892 [Xylaria sp. FL0064]|nr:hypothetical protein GGR55DRAFT_440892 [Xylaria sp. FL0064]
MLSILKRIHRVIRRVRRKPLAAPYSPPPPYESPEVLEGSSPPYERIDSHPICTEGGFWQYASTATLAAFMDAHKAKGSQEAIMSGTVSAFELAMREAFNWVNRKIIYLAFDSTECGLLMAAMAASLASLRGYALSWGSHNSDFEDVNSRKVLWDVTDEVQADAKLAGMDAGRKAISSACQLGIGPIPHSAVDVVLRRVASKAVTTVVQGICFEDATRCSTIIGTVDALDIGIRAAIDSGTPFKHTVAVLATALTAALTASRSGIASLSQAPGNSWCRSKARMAEAENEAVEAGVRAGKRYCRQTPG